MAPKKGGLHFGYHDHYAVDGGKARIILEVLVTPADVMENQPFLDMLWRARFRWQLRPRQVTGDTTYGTVENIVAVEDQNIRAYVPLADLDQRTPFYGPSRFTYDPEQDEYRCPRASRSGDGRPSTPRSRGLSGRRRHLQCLPAEGRLHREQARGGRSTAPSTPSYLDRVRGYHQTAAYEKAMAKRKVWVEPLFGEAKDWHGLRRFRLAALEGQRRGAADRDRPEPEAAAPEAGLGAPTMAKWGSGGPSARRALPNRSDGRLHSSDDREVAINRRYRAVCPRLGAGFFNGQACYARSTPDATSRRSPRTLLEARSSVHRRRRRLPTGLPVAEQGPAALGPDRHSWQAPAPVHRWHTSQAPQWVLISRRP